MATINVAYAARSAATITLASLATSSTWVAGRESTAIDNSSNKYVDILIHGKITVGTTPTAGTWIQVWVAPEVDDDVYPDVLDGTDSAETWTSVEIRDVSARLGANIYVNATTSDRAYYFNFSVASLFGGVVPRKFVLFVAHNTGVNLNSTGGNHNIETQGITYTSA